MHMHPAASKQTEKELIKVLYSCVREAKGINAGRMKTVLFGFLLVLGATVTGLSTPNQGNPSLKFESRDDNFSI